jgi:hypothetical protein
MSSNNIPIGETILRIQEQVLDEELSKYDAILQGAAADLSNKHPDDDLNNDYFANDDADDDESVLQRLRLMRLQQLQKEQSQKKEWQAAGHGTYTEISNTQNCVDVAQEFFRITKQSERVVVLFYRENQNQNAENYCDIFHKHFETLARTHWETKFCKLDVGRSEDRKGATFLVEQFRIRIIPTVLLIRNRKVVHQLHGLDEIPRGIHCAAWDVAATLAHHQVLKLTEQEQDKIETTSKKQQRDSSIRVNHHRNRNSSFDSDEDDKEDF